MINDLEQKLLSIIKTIEHVGHCNVCFHEVSQQLIDHIPGIPLYHRNSYCVTLKRLFPQAERNCFGFDRNSVIYHLQQQNQPFFKYCPYRATELIIPMFKEKLLCGIVFIGPFHCRNSLLPPNSLCGQSRIAPEMEDKIRRSFQRLPKLDATGVQDLMNMGLLLSSYLDQILAAIHLPEITGELNRKNQIEKFIADNGLNPIKLADLACFLGISLSRTSQLLRMYFGESLSDLVNRHRIDYAKSILKRSELPVKMVADKAGFESLEYFYRVFKKHTGLTPQQFRNQLTTST